ncbi:hypothetical protein ACH5RR_037676 [Cinchona calisaya]|uniref:F-box domain-containing protein n=1 Tax=Cinchona calisaya TaxID=153742 RepID=A0ABD2Y9X8_9GENT
MADSSSKRAKNYYSGREKSITRKGVPVDGDGDRISDLPDSVLVHILSCLPTKDAVATGVLSKRWQFLWTSVSSLEFLYSNRSVSTNIRKMSFPNIVNRVLLQHSARNSGSINKFSVQYCKFSGVDIYDAESWVITAISRGVRELELELRFLYTQAYPLWFILPSSVFTSKTLVVLKLCGVIMIHVPNSVCIPNLKTLYLHSVTFHDYESLRKLISSSLVLETLTIIRIYLDNAGKVCISAPTITRLKINFFMNQLCLQKFESMIVVEINAPALQYFDIDGYNPEVVIVTNCDNLIEANVGVDSSLWDDPEDNVIKFLKGVSKVKFLSITGFLYAAGPMKKMRECAMCVEQTSCSEPEVFSTKFSNLTHLTMWTSCVWHPLLRYFLENADNLEVLNFKEDIDSYDLNLDVISTEPEHAPRCLSSCLRAISVENFGSNMDEEDEFVMLKFFLKNGKVLRTLEISNLCIKSKVSMLQKKISKFPRASEMCEIIIY